MWAWLVSTALARSSFARRVAAAIVGFSPSQIFAGNEPGIWLDPSDLSTMFQDGFTETPVTAVGQPIGFVASKDQADNLQPWVNYPTSSTAGWLTGNGQTGLTSNGTSVTVENLSTVEAQIIAAGFNVVAGRTYMVTLQVDAFNGANGVVIVGGTRVSITGGVGIKRYRVVAGSTATNGVRIGTNSVTQGQSATISNINVREIKGNYAFQTTAASRPILGRNPAAGVRNLAVGSADVGNTSVWPATVVHNGVTATKIASGIDTDGLPYVDYRYQGTATNTFHSTTYGSAISRNPASVGLTYTASAYSRMISGTANNPNLRVAVVEETAPSTYIGQSSSNVAGETDTFLTASRTFSTGNQVRTEIILQMVNGAAIDVTYRIKGIQLELGAARTAFQFSYSSTNVTESGFADCYFLSFDGVDDFLTTNTITPGADKVQSFVGLRKLSDAAESIPFEFGNGSGFDGTLSMAVGGGVGNAEEYTMRSRGQTNNRYAFTNDVAFNAPNTAVVSGLCDIGGDSVLLRTNGVVAGTNNQDQGTTNYLAYPLFIGRRAGSSGAFAGNIYSLILRFGTNLTSWTINQIEDWVNIKTGAWQAFSPASLFAAGEQGIWLDPSDFPTMFQDNLGATPVTAVGQTVGLGMDKSQNQALGPELIVNGSFTSGNSGWALLGVGNTTTFTGGAAQIQGDTAPGLRRSGIMTVGKIYQVSLRVRRVAGTALMFVVPNIPVPIIGSDWQTVTFIRGTTSSNFDVGLAGAATGSIIEVTDISVKEVLGNHATQATAASRPILGRSPATGSRNLAPFSEDLAGGWTTAYASGATRSGASITVNTSEGAGYHRRNNVVPTTGVFSVAFDIVCDQTVAAVPIRINNNDSSTVAFQLVDMQAGVTQRIKFENLPVGTSTAIDIGVDARSAIVPGGSNNTGYTVTFNRVQVEAGAVATAYQKTGAGTWDVTETGVPDLYYLAFDGVDDFLVTNVINPGVDKSQVFAGITKVSGGEGQILELSPGAPNTIQLRANFSSSPNYIFTSRGDAGGAIIAQTPSTYIAPVTNTITGLGDIAADVVRVRINGSGFFDGAGDQGNGNYAPATAALYIGRRGGTSLSFNGRIYSLICRFGPNLTNAQIAAAERYVAERTRAY